MKTRIRTAIGYLIDTLKLMGLLGHRDSGCLLTENFRAMLHLHSMVNCELARHLKESPSNVTYLSPDIQNELITVIGEEILSSISSEVKMLLS